MAERIWAPWRMEYIRSVDSEKAGCVLCGYIGAELRRETGVLARWAHSYVVLNKYPYAAGHLMVVPAEHCSELGAIPASDYDELFRLVREAAAALKEATEADAMNIGINIGRPAGAGIHEHLHVHLVPRWTGDHNFMPVLADVRVLPEVVGSTWDRLAPYFAKLDEGTSR